MIVRIGLTDDIILVTAGKEYTIPAATLLVIWRHYQEQGDSQPDQPAQPVQPTPRDLFLAAAAEGGAANLVGMTPERMRATAGEIAEAAHMLADALERRRR